MATTYIVTLATNQDNAEAVAAEVQRLTGFTFYVNPDDGRLHTTATAESLRAIESALAGHYTVYSQEGRYDRTTNTFEVSGGTTSTEPPAPGEEEAAPVSDEERVTELQTAIHEARADLGDTQNTVYGITDIPTLERIASALGIDGATAPPGEEATDGTGPKLNQAPDGGEVWLNTETNQAYLAYFVPGTEPPVPMLWAIDQDDLQANFGEGQTIVYTHRYTTSQINSYGAIQAGLYPEIANTTENPFDAWSSAVEKQAAVRPWLRDPEVLALVAEAMVEGRPLSDAEFQQTEWWRSASESQRQWAVLSESDPMTAGEIRADNRNQVKAYFEQMGAEGVPVEVINQVADQFTYGNWTDLYWRRQAEAIGDPASNYALDPEIEAMLAGSTISTTQQYQDRVRELASEWLGPVYGNMDEGSLDRWARKLRVSADGQDELINYLRQNRLSLFPEYENPNLTYEDLAGPWRTVMNNMWGQTPDETDTIFDQLIRNNDRVANEELLRSEGLNRNIEAVVQDMQSSALRSFGGSVRRPVSG